ncbi:hypothetical protein ACE7GA_18665 [Roseomonas sp. CCTCC AB2023176]|uniref:hypothetical protein n=1 Tax=Roseomonas sp. CCTCC AB2023176 TaxID=3342640 RepID=UPI0035D78C3B
MPDTPDAASGGPVVTIRDLSGASDAPEEVRGFRSLADAATFARRYVRDSVERCRVPGASADDTLNNWFAFGEDAEARDATGQGWTSTDDIRNFAAKPARSQAERDWRSLDPRRDRGDDEDEEDEPPEDDVIREPSE